MGRLENQFLAGLSNFTEKCLEIMAANGIDNVSEILCTLMRTRPNAKIVVFTDLGNISAQYRLLRKRCTENTNIRFFDCNCFEDLLSEGELISSFSSFDENVFDHVTLEKFYEKKLARLTNGSLFSMIIIDQY